MEDRKVRIAINSNNILIQTGDPLSVEMDTEYMDIIREGGIVAVITYHQYQRLKLYEKVDFKAIF